MALADRVHIARRFQRAVRIDADVDDVSALEGFVCPRSSADVLLSMARHLSETGHGAFTWTGPYGSGKSSLVVALSALLSGEKTLTASAFEAIGEDASEAILKAMPPGKSGWLTVPVVGCRENPVHAIGEALTAGKCADRPKGGWSESALVAELNELAARKTGSVGGVILFIDEMGKFLENAAHSGGDAFVFQQLAEAASRSGGRLVMVGILHQAFEEYANRLSRERRDEWSKIQGRFVDLPINVAGEEQLDLISRAIESDGRDGGIESVAKKTAALIREQRPAASSHLEDALIGCWPMHPAAACLLGPISRRRFGQNQRSIFGFLNSAEPQGLQDFLRDAADGELYTPVRLWDYLQYNLEPSILASPDGHRWSLAVEAVQRCEALGGDRDHLALLKTIALIDIFRERSGLSASESMLAASCDGLTKKAFADALRQLRKWSLIVFRKFAGGYAIFAGSDFDVENAIEAALAETGDLDFSSLGKLADIQPIVAKRHYHETGTLRRFDVDLVPVGELRDAVDRHRPDHDAVGQFILAVSTESDETDKACDKAAREALRTSDDRDWDVVVGVATRSRAITGLAHELRALEYVRAHSPELAGDPVARREVAACVGDVRGRLESELQKAFDNADWYHRTLDNRGRRASTGTSAPTVGKSRNSGNRGVCGPKKLFQAELNGLASDLADDRFHRSPIVFNELLNRVKPSSSAAAARNLLLRRMVANEGEPRLGIEGFPAEGGLFASLLETTGLYAEKDGAPTFREPSKGRRKDASRLWPIWKAANDHLKKNGRRSVPVSELYDVWREAPFGVRDGLMPVLAVAYMLSRRRNLAFYRQGVFQGHLSDLDMDYLVKDAGDVQLRWMDLSELSRRLLSGMAEIVRELDRSNELTDMAPIDVARGLIAIYATLPPWTRRTMRLSKNASRVRQLFKKANDPNKFLFDDLPESLTGETDIDSEEGVRRIVETVREGLEELCGAYPTMLRRLRDTTLAELQVPNTSSRSLAELRERAENVRELAGDYRLDAFAGRLVGFAGGDEHVEGLAGLAANKPTRDWVDTDTDRAAIELADLAQKFVRAEAFARVKGRADKRHAMAMAVVVGIDGRPTPITGEFDVVDRDREDIDRLIEQVEGVLDQGDLHKRDVVLAALAQLSARYLDPINKGKAQTRPARKVLHS